MRTSMKDSKKRENSSSKKKKHAKSLNLDSWDQTDLEFADEKVLEKRLHQLKLQLQLAQEETQDSARSSSKHAKNKKKPPSDDSASSDSDDTSDSDSSFSSASSSSVNRYDRRKSSSASEDDRKKRTRALINHKKAIKETKSRRSPVRNERENNSSKNDKKISSIRRKISPAPSKHGSRARIKRSPSLDKKEVYSRGDTGRWHEKAKEATRDRIKHEKERSRSRGRGRPDRNRSTSPIRERTLARSKERAVKNTIRNTSASSRRKESPETRPRVFDSGRRTGALFMRKNSPRDDRLARHDDKRLDLKITRRNDIRANDVRDSNSRTTKDPRTERKDPPSTKLREEPSRERDGPLLKSRRDSPIHRNDPRDRSRLADDRLKDRYKKLAHDRLEPDRVNNRGIRNDSGRDTSVDKFRRGGDRVLDTNRTNSRHVNESVFDRMRNRYNDRRNAENQRFARTERDRLPVKDRISLNDKDMPKNRAAENNGADRSFRDRRPMPVVRARSPYRERKEPFRVDRKTPVNYERKFSSPTATRKAREDNRVVHNRRRSLENEDPQWNKKKGLNKTRSRSRSSERRKRRRSSQEEWRIIDMTSPVLDDDLSEENSNKNTENNALKMKRPATKIRNKLKAEESDDNENKLNKTILTDELSDISDEDFSDINTINSIKFKRENLSKPDRSLRLEKNNRKPYQKDEDLDLDRSATAVTDQDNNKNLSATQCGSNDVDDLMGDRDKLTDDESRVDIEKNEHLDSEEDTVSRVSDAIGVDWAELVEESKRKTPALEESSKLIRKRWSGTNIFAKIGISEKYAGKEIYDQVRNDLLVNYEADDKTKEEEILHGVAGLHVSLRDKMIKRKTLFEPYKTAISARKDIIIRRRLCGLPVKNINTQQMIGICHWIV